jgi:DNA-binding response OmpR family regulator
LEVSAGRKQRFQLIMWISVQTVLVVDDDQSIRGMVRSVLHRQGFEVDLAESGNEAIARILVKRYDAVVLDVMMGNGSGHDVLETLATQRPGVKCVVVISASSPGNIEKVEITNVQAKLRKPFDIQELVAAIETCVATTSAATTPGT